MGTYQVVSDPRLESGGLQQRNSPAPGRAEPGRTPRELAEEMRERGAREAGGWAACQAPERNSTLEGEWTAASEAIRQAVAPRDDRRGETFGSEEVVWLVENGVVLETALAESHDAIRRCRRLPHVEARKGRIPRAYAVAASYVRGAGFAFEEGGFRAFLRGVQERTPLQSREIWQLKPFLQLALAEELGRAARAMADERGPGTAGRQGGSRIPALVQSLRRVSELDWKQLFESASAVEAVLRNDPVYAQMDFESREGYRRAVEEVSERSPLSEQEVAQRALELARCGQEAGGEAERARKSHVGYYLVDEGRAALEQAVGHRPSLGRLVRTTILRRPERFYLTLVGALTAAVVAATSWLLRDAGWGLILAAALLLPAAECAVAVAGLLSTLVARPNRLPRLDFSKGIPEEATTMVAVPALLFSAEQVQRAVRDLEVRFLANRDAHLHFALVTDLPDGEQRFDEGERLTEMCSRMIGEMNERYAGEGSGSFFHFHRHRSFNAGEGRWMGWERKRGKLLEFNNLLLGRGDSFPVKVGDASVLGRVKYVIALDLDTQLPRDAARKLAGTMAHPLNRAVVDPQTRTVKKGYGILQPRVAISARSAGRSRLAKVFSGDVGFDIYTRAVSDVYHDLFGEATFTGKGIYEVQTFQQVLDQRFPCNTVLSHDLLEGAHARAGYVSDVEVVDDYPARLSSYSSRKHRWARGDWQIARWVSSQVPDAAGAAVANPLNLLSRWKIADNLRRSVNDAALLAALLCGWVALRGGAVAWTLAVLGLAAAPAYCGLGMAVARAGRARYQRLFWRSLAAETGLIHARLFCRVALLMHQGLLEVDAVVRTLVRMTVTHRGLLEWETAAEAETAGEKHGVAEMYLDWTPVAVLAAGTAVALLQPFSLAAALPLLALWASSRRIAEWLDQPPRAQEGELEGEDRAMLRRAALRTWRFFREFSHEGENWLIPDFVEEGGDTANRISPTNLGLLLNARQAALDLGFTTLPEFTEATTKTLAAMERMPREKGHFYNWYDTRTLEPAGPRFLSTVDSGNLVCSLWALKHGCLEAMREPLFREALWQGVLDHIEAIREALPEGGASAGLAGAVGEWKAWAESLSGNVWAWAEALPRLRLGVEALEGRLAEAGAENEEARRAAGELRERVGQLEALARDYAPWCLPEFAAHSRRLGITDQVRARNVTPSKLPAMAALLDAQLAALPEGEESGAKRDTTVEALREALARSARAAEQTGAALAELATTADRLAKEMQFGGFYNADKKLMAIGYDAERGSTEPYHYDLLASEARTAVFAAIAKGEVPQEAWFHLGRAYTTRGTARALLSWTGTMFEYLMPLLWMRAHPGSILEQTARAAVAAQQEATGEQMPWGISESCCSARNAAGHYEYRAFGLPELALNPNGHGELVVAPYAAFLALLADAAAAARNLREMRRRGWMGRYGFYEAADFSRLRVGPKGECELVRCWMAHHQGMSLVAAANVLCEGPMQRRFHSEPMVAATERLLHERFPAVPATGAVVRRTLGATALLPRVQTRRGAPALDSPAQGAA